MTLVHSKSTVITVGGADLSAFTNESSFGRKADKHDVTTYGKNDHVYAPGLGDGDFSMGGVYDNSVTGPRDVLEPLVGTMVTVIRKPEGTGSGLPQDSFSSLLEEYVGPRTAAIYLINPNNPDGYLPPRAEIDVLLAVASRHDLTVIADEAYERCIHEGELASA